MEYTLFIFRRDYRLEDNNGLIWASKKLSKYITNIYIYTRTSNK